MHPEDIDGLISFFEECVTEERKALIDEKLNSRTKFITVVLEDIYNSHNASAVVRSCECFGIQDLHVVEQRNEYSLSPGVTMGSSKWITLNRYYDPKSDNIKVCYDSLKEAGYRILATTSDPNAIHIREYKLETPVALAFGTELNGLTDYAREQADEFVHIPMLGFTESFNISVSAAICLYELTGKLHDSELQWELNETQRRNLKLEWYKKAIRRSKSLEKEFFKQRQQS
jgi:tRNA (guanosine-2'-O-)-methyltransferase